MDNFIKNTLCELIGCTQSQSKLVALAPILISIIGLIVSISSFVFTFVQYQVAQKNLRVTAAINLSLEYNKTHDWFADHDNFVGIISGLDTSLSASELRQDRIKLVNYSAYVASLALNNKIDQSYISDDLNCLLVHLAELRVHNNGGNLAIGGQFETLRKYQTKFHAECRQSGVQF